MNTANTALSTTIGELDQLKRAIRANVNKQVVSSELRSRARAVGFAWFQTHRPSIASMSEAVASKIDPHYQAIISAADRATSKSVYDAIIGKLRTILISARSEIISHSVTPRQPSSDVPPDFALLIKDARMRDILVRRWNECALCVRVEANLAATVLMGGLLEALLLTRVLQHHDKSIILNAKCAPKDKAGTSLPLDKWTLKDYIALASELKWISSSAKDVGVVLQEYRNLIHPQKEFSERLDITPGDTQFRWEVAKVLCKDLL